MKYFFSILLLLCNATIGLSQTSPSPEMADVMRANGKIYVVVGTLLIILIGVIYYLVSLDKKISKLEKNK